MKTQILILVFSVFSLAAFATGNPSARAEKSKSLIVETAHWKSEKLNVQIKEASGVVILDETLKNNKNIRKYNLKNLPEGKYTIEVSNDQKIMTQEFAIESNELVLSQEIRTEYKPMVIVNKNIVDVNLLTLGNKAFINLVDRDNNIVFAENLETPAVHKRYDLSSLASGDYTLSVAMNGRSYTTNFSK
jgi:hypothetical protein